MSVPKKNSSKKIKRVKKVRASIVLEPDGYSVDIKEQQDSISFKELCDPECEGNVKDAYVMQKFMKDLESYMNRVTGKKGEAKTRSRIENAEDLTVTEKDEEIKSKKAAQKFEIIISINAENLWRNVLSQSYVKEILCARLKRTTTMDSYNSDRRKRQMLDVNHNWFQFQEKRERLEREYTITWKLSRVKEPCEVDVHDPIGTGFDIHNSIESEFDHNAESNHATY